MIMYQLSQIIDEIIIPINSNGKSLLIENNNIITYVTIKS